MNYSLCYQVIAIDIYKTYKLKEGGHKSCLRNSGIKLSLLTSLFIRVQPEQKSRNVQNKLKMMLSSTYVKLRLYFFSIQYSYRNVINTLQMTLH